jgi:hypothetical protein
MSIDETIALQALLARFMVAAERRDIAQELSEAASKWALEERQQIKNLQAGFLAFDLDLKVEGAWKRLAERIGQAAYNTAIREGKALARSNQWDAEVKTHAETSFVVEVKATIPAPAPPAREAAEAETVDASDSVATSEGAAATSQAETGSANDAITGTVVSQRIADEAGASDGEPPSVRETVLERLKLAGDKGLKAADVRQYYEDTFSAKLHEKTIGMTLYRLSKENLARREGRTWFYAPLNEGETKNPGGRTPGLVDVFK